MFDNPRLQARLRLSLVQGLGPVLQRRLEEQIGDPEAVCEASVGQLQQVEGIGSQRAGLFRRALDESDVTAELERIERAGVDLLSIDEERYPALLRHIPDPPPLLYVRGEIRREDGLALALVGARDCTSYGREQADRFAALGVQAGLTIVSGGARGIDEAAHRAALRAGGRTIAVLGSGLGVPYPQENLDLFAGMADGRGAVVSELPMTVGPRPEHFPRRNRIVSGLALAVLVVEAGPRSGALITARLAAEEHHREVLALPGRVDSRCSVGCHRMIREGWATLVTNGTDVLDALGEAGQTLKAAMEPPEERPQQAAGPRSGLEPALAEVLEAIPAEATGIDRVAEVTRLPVGVLQGHLTHLQLTGWIERLSANRVRRRR